MYVAVAVAVAVTITFVLPAPRMLPLISSHIMPCMLGHFVYLSSVRWEAATTGRVRSMLSRRCKDVNVSHIPLQIKKISPTQIL